MIIVGASNSEGDPILVFEVSTPLVPGGTVIVRCPRGLAALGLSEWEAAVRGVASCKPDTQAEETR